MAQEYLGLLITINSNTIGNEWMNDIKTFSLNHSKTITIA